MAARLLKQLCYGYQGGLVLAAEKKRLLESRGGLGVLVKLHVCNA